MSDEKRFDRIDEKLDRLNDRMGAVDTTLAVNTEQLRIHVRRTDLLEEQVQTLQEAKFKLSGMQRAAVYLGGVTSFVLTALELWTKLR